MSCCTSTITNEEFLASLDEETRRLIESSEGAPELVNSGEEVFAQFERHELTLWARAQWELLKEVVDATMYDDWDNLEHPWNRDMQDFWKYPIAFASYGIPSLVLIDPSLYDEACAYLRKLLLLLKDAGSFDEWTRLEFSKDPVTDKNVMYKGHLNLVYGIYQLLSGSREFEDEYRHLNGIIVSESMRNAHDHGFWGIECEPDQYFSPCNSMAMLSEVVYDRNFGTHQEAEVARPTWEWLHEHMVDPATGITLFRYHPSCDFAEPYTIGSLWAESCLHYFDHAELERGYESIKREYLPDIKGGRECYLKANRFTAGASSDYEQVTMVLYVPLGTREFNDPEQWEKITRFFCDMYAITLVNGVARYTSAAPAWETHCAGYLFLGAVHLGWDTILNTDWAAFRAERGCS